MMLLWFAAVSVGQLSPVRAESALLLEVLDYNITFDVETLQQFTQCLSAPENILCSLNITGCSRPFILNWCSAGFAAHQAAQLNTTLTYINYYSCELLVVSEGTHERPNAISCHRLRDASGYNLWPEHCTRLSASSNLTNQTEYVTIVWKPSQQFSVKRIYNITASYDTYGVCILTNKVFSTSDTNNFHLVITVPVIGCVIVILVVTAIILLCWKRKGKVWNKKHTGVRRPDSLNCSAILKSYAISHQETTPTPEHPPGGRMLVRRETDHSPVTAINLDTGNIYCRLHEDVVRLENTYDVLNQ